MRKKNNLEHRLRDSYSVGLPHIAFFAAQNKAHSQ